MYVLIYNQHAGKPYALRSGIREAKGKYVLLTDMDQSTPISELAKLMPWISKGYKVIIGSRGARRADTTPLRQLASVVFLLIRRLILLPEIKDTQCGFKLVETELARNIFARMRLFGRVNNAVGWKVTAYDVELLHLAKKLGAKIKEVGVVWKNEDTTLGKSRNFVKESIEMLFEIMRVRVNDMLGKYNV
jgi:Glycosyltransferases involved in cell wall biogenesis